MKLLEDIARGFSTSRPIFELTMDEECRRISLNTGSPIHKYEPTVKEDDIIETLVASHYNESFLPSQGRFVVDHSRIALDAMNEIRSSMSTFLEKNLDMKNPRQSKLYRWYYRSLPSGYDFNGALVSLYKYIRTFAGETMNAPKSSPHVANTIAVMEAIMEKYDNEK